MEQQDGQSRGLKSSGADGGDLLLAQAQLWIGLGEALGKLLRRMRVGRYAEAAEEAERDGAAGDEQGGRRSPDQEAA